MAFLPFSEYNNLISESEFRLYGSYCQVKSEKNMPQSAKIKPQSPEVENIGKKINVLRKERGYTQAELARKMGVNQKLVSDYEVNRLRPHHEIIVRLALALEVSADELLGLGNPNQDREIMPERKILTRMKKIESLPQSQQKFILRVIDSLLKAVQIP